MYLVLVKDQNRETPVMKSASFKITCHQQGTILIDNNQQPPIPKRKKKKKWYQKYWYHYSNCLPGTHDASARAVI
jgi:hypothetical protein